jgi:membrane-associated phospholipid phosphatase
VKGALERNLLAWGLVTALCVVPVITWLDAPIAYYFNSFKGTALFSFFQAITDFANGVIWYSLALIGIGVAYARHSKRAKTPNLARLRQEIRAWVFMIVSMASSGILINAMKFAIGRERPRFLIADGLSEFHPFALRIADSSFPSGHTQSIWTAMLSLSFLFPALRPLFLLIAAVVGSSRIIVGAHYLGDVLASIFIAFATVLLWRQWFTKDGISVTLWERRFPTSA